MLASVLPAAKPGDRILVAAGGDGADAMLLRVTPAVANYRPRHSVGRHDRIQGRRFVRATISNGARFCPPSRRAGPIPSVPRDRRCFAPSAGSSAWSARDAPRAAPRNFRRSAYASNAARAIRWSRIRSRIAPRAIATFALDRLAYSLNPPTVNVVLDFEGGGRFLCEMTDCEPEKIAIGDEVEMTFRRLFTADGVHNYFWKARPKR